MKRPGGALHCRSAGRSAGARLWCSANSRPADVADAAVILRKGCFAGKAPLGVFATSKRVELRFARAGWLQVCFSYVVFLHFLFAVARQPSRLFVVLLPYE